MVVFPAPLRPTRAVVFPLGSRRLTPLSTAAPTLPGYSNETPWRSTSPASAACGGSGAEGANITASV